MNYLLDASLLVAVIIGLSELMKIYVKAKYLPLLNMVYGILGSIIYFEGDLKTKVLSGIVAGLASSGLFDLTKVITKK